jgi:hypothetical protein
MSIDHPASDGAGNLGGAPPGVPPKRQRVKVRVRIAARQSVGTHLLAFLGRVAGTHSGSYPDVSYATAEKGAEAHRTAWPAPQERAAPPATIAGAISTPVSNRWRRVTVAVLTAVLLAPVPVFATLTWVSTSNWSISSGTTTNVNPTLGVGYGTGGQTDWLFIQPTSNNTNTAITLQRDFFVTPSSGVTATAVLSSLQMFDNGNIKVAVWTTPTAGGAEGDIIGSSTTPMTFTGPSNQFSDFSGNGPLLIANTSYTLHVQFAINSTNWQSVPGSPSNITFEFNTNQ